MIFDDGATAAATKRLGISQGMENNEFVPDSEITRAGTSARDQMASSLFNLLKA